MESATSKNPSAQRCVERCGIFQRPRTHRHPPPPQAPILLVFWRFLLVFMGIRRTCGHAITPCDILSALLTVPCCTIDHLHSSRPWYQAFSDDLNVRPVGRCPSIVCTLLPRCGLHTPPVPSQTRTREGAHPAVFGCIRLWSSPVCRCCEDGARDTVLPPSHLVLRDVRPVHRPDCQLEAKPIMAYAESLASGITRLPLPLV